MKKLRKQINKTIKTEDLELLKLLLKYYALRILDKYETISWEDIKEMLDL